MKEIGTEEYLKSRLPQATAFYKWTHKKEILQNRFCGEKAGDVWTPHDYSDADAQTLIKQTGKEFTVLNITDPHFADYDVRTLMAIPAAKTIGRLVREVRPDLITVTGDIICSDSAVFSIRRFCDLMESFSVPWAPIFGNHDDESNCDLDFIGDLFLRCPHCLFRKGDPALGAGNYVLHIAENTPTGKSVVESLILMYHRNGRPNEAQLEWYKWAAAGVKKLSGGAAEIALFLHIPLPEYQFARESFFDEAGKCWKPDADACGEIHEKICCEWRDGRPYRRGFFEAIKDAGNTKHVFCGHEHLNDFSAVYDDVRLTYTLKVGKGSGGGFGLNGGTVIRIGNNGISRITHRAINGPIKYDKEDILIR